MNDHFLNAVSKKLLLIFSVFLELKITYRFFIFYSIVKKPYLHWRYSQKSNWNISFIDVIIVFRIFVHGAACLLHHAKTTDGFKWGFHLFNLKTWKYFIISGWIEPLFRNIVQNGLGLLTNWIKYFLLPLTFLWTIKKLLLPI